MGGGWGGRGNILVRGRWTMVKGRWIVGEKDGWEKKKIAEGGHEGK